MDLLADVMATTGIWASLAGLGGWGAVLFSSQRHNTPGVREL